MLHQLVESSANLSQIIDRNILFKKPIDWFWLLKKISTKTTRFFFFLKKARIHLLAQIRLIRGDGPSSHWFTSCGRTHRLWLPISFFIQTDWYTWLLEWSLIILFVDSKMCPKLELYLTCERASLNNELQVNS